MRKVSLVGNVYGDLTVIKESDEKTKRVKWLCRCSCGNDTIVSSYHLVGGDTNSCGCRRSRFLIDRWIKKGRKSLLEIGQRDHYLAYRTAARKRDIEFSISKERFLEIVSMDCEYCGAAPVEKVHFKAEDRRSYVPGHSIVHKGNGIDRIDSRIGYVEGNCVPSCGTCNTMKMSMSVEDFKSHIKKINNHSGSFNFSLIDMCKNESAVLEFISKAA